MSMNKEETRFWMDKGESAVVELRTRGVVEEYKGKKTRIMGTKVFMHIATSTIFDGNKTALCGGRGCPFCENGHKASVQIRDVPVVVDSKEVVWTMQKSLNNVIGEKLDAMLEFGHKPEDFKYKVKHTQLKYPENWEVDVIRKEGSEQTSLGSPIGSPQIPDETPQTPTQLTEEETVDLAAIDEYLETSGDDVSPEDWVATLTEVNGWDYVRAKDVVRANIGKDGRLIVE